AGAVGIDLDADASIFDLCTLDNFIKRAGRVNRSGDCENAASIDLVHTRNDFANSKGKGKSRRWKIVRPNLLCTLNLLRQLPVKGGGLDASPDALTALVASPYYRKACEPLPR